MNAQLMYLLTVDRQQTLRREADDARLAMVASRAADGASKARKSPSIAPTLRPWAPIEAIVELFSPGGRALAPTGLGEEAARA